MIIPTNYCHRCNLINETLRIQQCVYADSEIFDTDSSNQSKFAVGSLLHCGMAQNTASQKRMLLGGTVRSVINQLTSTMCSGLGGTEIRLVSSSQTEKRHVVEWPE